MKEVRKIIMACGYLGRLAEDEDLRLLNIYLTEQEKPWEINLYIQKYESRRRRFGDL